MLFCESIEELLHNAEVLKLAQEPGLAEEITTALSGILADILQEQDNDGIWKDDSSTSPEEVAYTALTLQAILNTDIGLQRKETISDAIKRRQMFLEDNWNDWSSPKPIWIGKVAYSVKVISKAYCLAAIAVVV
jgi:hypothetical protein